jgi:MFS family permease
MDTERNDPAAPPANSTSAKPQPATGRPGLGRHTEAWAPLRHPLFLAMWAAAFVSNIGTWMQNIAASWLMTSLSPSPLLVALVQTATSLPFFLLALPGGALADVVDRRRLLLLAQFWMLGAAAALGVLTLAGAASPWVLLTFTFLLGGGAAMTGPAWMAAIPELVPRRELSAAVALNSVGFNLALAVGPALGGLVIAAVGEGAHGAGISFLLNAASFLAVVAVLYFWKRPHHASVLPAERMIGAIRAGLRYARHAPPLWAVFVRTAAFVLCASALWSLLPLLVRHELGRGSLDYGVLLGAFGVGSVGGAAFLPRLRHRFGPDAVVASATVLFAAVLAILAWVRAFPLLCVAMALGGVAWLCLVSTLMVAVQTLVPSWVRGRALAVFMVVFQGAMTAGSALFGGVADWVGVAPALALAALALLVSVPALWRLRLPSGEDPDLSPSPHWSAHEGMDEPENDRGPVLIVVEYRIDPARAADFARAMRPVRRVRLRDGAMRWGLFHDTTDAGRYIETFLVESWVEHLRQHERMTVADQAARELARTFHLGPPPAVSHYVANPPG